MLALFSKGKYEYAIIGLGNPGGSYEGTRHNAGFMAADFVAEKCGAAFKKKFRSHCAEIVIGGKKAILQKPDTFMNSSGLAVRDMAAFYRIPAKNIIVMHDDITLVPGKFKIKNGGSDGGHNGLKSIIEELRDWDFLHIKLGVGPKPIKEQPLADFVLQTMPAEEKKRLCGRFEDIYGALEMIVGGQLEAAKAKYNHDAPDADGNKK